MISLAQLSIVLPLILVVAILYSSVGHGGASGYLAILAMIISNVRDYVTLILILNIIVALISFISFQGRSQFSVRRLLPFVVASIPCSFIGAAWKVSHSSFELALGFGLMLAALRLSLWTKVVTRRIISEPQLWFIAVPIGSLLGLLSGMIGIGGGIFLSPIVILLGIVDIKGSAAMASAFIVLNSSAALFAKMITASHSVLHAPFWPLFIIVALIGAQLGSKWGANRAGSRKLQYVLASVLLLASTKLIFGAL